MNASRIQLPHAKTNRAPIAVRLRILLAVTTAACLLLLSACTNDASVSTSPAELSPPPKNTIVTARLDEPIVPGKNVVWCATFQLAWNELMDYAGGPVTMTDAPPMVNSLNRRDFTKADIDSNSYVAIAGRLADGTFNKARNEVAAKFPAHSPVLLSAVQNWPPDAVMMYAMISKHLPFEYAFSRDILYFQADPNADDMCAPRISSFGFHQYAPREELHARQGPQVRIIHYDKPTRGSGRKARFVVELLAKSRADRMILAMLPSGRTLRDTIAEAMRLVNKPNTLTVKLPFDGRKVRETLRSKPEKLAQYACMLPMESLKVPIVDLSLCRKYTELHGRKVIAANSNLNGMPIVLAKQAIQLRLDEKGGSLKSEAVGAFWGAGARNFDFDRPFLLMLLKRGASRPYFAAWIGNTELLEKHPTSPD